jgi:predicted DNA-binding antitoxin AbrB/MazE fold protein
MAGKQEEIRIKNPSKEVLDILEGMQSEKEKRHKEFLENLTK